jgi:hypothetical protein
MFRSMGLACLLLGVVAQAAEIPEMPVAPRPATAVAVNCNNGESIQAAVDANAAPVEIQITGICVENVLIRDKDVSLRGTQKPSLDGIRSVIPLPALAVRGSVIAEINDLSFSNSPGQGLAVRGGASMAVNNCLFENNGTGLRVDSGAFVLGNALTFTGNGNSNTNTSAAQFFCIGCDFSGGGPAAVSTRSAVASLLDSVVTGSVGIVADQNGAHVDFDCATVNTPHACSMTVTGPAAIATFGGTAVLVGAGNFTGQLIADDRGTVRLNGSLQRVGASGGQPNIVDSLGQIIVSPLFDVTPPAQSLIRDTNATHFGRVLLTDSSALQGSIQCSGAADAFLDRTVIRSQGSAVTGCENGIVR